MKKLALKAQKIADAFTISCNKRPLFSKVYFISNVGSRKYVISMELWNNIF